MVLDGILKMLEVYSPPNLFLSQISTYLCHILIYQQNVIYMKGNFYKHKLGSIFNDSINVFRSFTEKWGDQTENNVNSDLLNFLIKILSHEDPNVRSDAMHSLCNIVSCSYERTLVVFSCTEPTNLKTLLEHSDEDVRTVTLNFLSAVTEGKSRRQRQAFIDANLLPYVIKNISGENLEVKKEAANVLKNVTGIDSNMEYILQFIHNDVVESLCALFNYNEADYGAMIVSKIK